jgi:hypothetical protein
MGNVSAASLGQESPVWPLELSSEEVDALYAYVGVDELARSGLKSVAFCESRWRPGAVGDSGASLGMHQLNWSTWFPYALGLGLVTEEDRERWADPVVNTKVALGAMRYDEGRGYPRFKQWTCQP